MNASEAVNLAINRALRQGVREMPNDQLALHIESWRAHGRDDEGALHFRWVLAETEHRLRFGCPTPVQRLEA